MVNTQSTKRDDNGYYEFSGLEAGEYTLTFEKSGYTNQTLDITLKAEEILEGRDDYHGIGGQREVSTGML